MAKRASLTSKALNFLYKIRIDEFIKSPIDSNGENNGVNYKADLVVDKHPEYPDIPPSTWTITLTITNADSEICDDVEPKGGPESLQSSRLVLVDWRARMGRMGENVKSDPRPEDCHRHIGPEGFQQDLSKPLRDLLQRPRFGQQRGLNPCASVLVSLTFMVEKTTSCRGLSALYESGLLADCTLICGERDFPAHRAILAAQSPVFAAMFQNDMKEKSSGICPIKDIHPDVLDALLQFVYTGELTKANGLPDALWTAADKYDIPDLQQECERLMLRSITDDNALDYLNFAAQRGLNKIVVAAAKVIAQRPT